MKRLSEKTSAQRRVPASVLGLALDGNHLEGVVVHQRKGALQAAQTFTARLALDPLTNEPELVGREILNHLESAGIRQRHCVVALPLKWALTASTPVPPLPEADMAGFLQIEAERGFPCDADTLRVVTSRTSVYPGKARAALIGIPSEHLERLGQALRAARLKPLSLVPAVAALQPPSEEQSNGVLALVLDPGHVALQVTCGGGVAALRVLDGALETEGGQPLVHSDLVTRETRIALGQLEPEWRAAVKRVRLFGPPSLTGPLAAELCAYFGASGLSVETVEHYEPTEFGAPAPSGIPVGPAFSLAARFLTGRASCLEFLPPYVSPWKRLVRLCASGRLRAIGAVAAVVLALLVGAFSVQQWQLSGLNAQWGEMAATVDELKALQERIQQYRPWFDESLTSLTILRELARAFPEDGSVTAKTLEIRNNNAVSCGGTTRDRTALLQTLARLRAVESVHDVKVEQIRGTAPLQFSFTFQYGTESSHED